MTPIRARNKIITSSALGRRVAKARGRGERIVFTNGCFDLLHVGHVRSLEQARGHGDRLIVAVNSDASARRAKGRERPIQPARIRMEIIAALACVDWVVGFRADTPFRLIQTLQPDILAKGGDWTLDSIVGGAEVVGWGGRVIRTRVVPGQRSTSLVERIRNSSARGKR